MAGLVPNWQFMSFLSCDFWPQLFAVFFTVEFVCWCFIQWNFWIVFGFSVCLSEIAFQLICSLPICLVIVCKVFTRVLPAAKWAFGNESFIHFASGTGEKSEGNFWVSRCHCRALVAPLFWVFSVVLAFCICCGTGCRTAVSSSWHPVLRFLFVPCTCRLHPLLCYYLLHS